MLLFARTASAIQDDDRTTGYQLIDPGGGANNVCTTVEQRKLREKRQEGEKKKIRKPEERLRPDDRRSIDKHPTEGEDNWRGRSRVAVRWAGQEGRQGAERRTTLDSMIFFLLFSS
jgi:hypothetical protein